MFEMTENEFNECEQAERIKHDEKVKELEAQNKNLKAVVADYNKAKAEIKLLKETHRQSLKILTDQIEELHKANEWHYVKDGKYPKENQLVLLYRENPNGANVALAYWYKSYVNDKVIAWKEIVLPKE